MQTPMTKELLDKALDKVRALHGDEICPLTVEEAGALRAYVDARQKCAQASDQERAFLTRIGGLLNAWQASVPPLARAQAAAGAGAGQRTQLTLRRAVLYFSIRSYLFDILRFSSLVWLKPHERQHFVLPKLPQRQTIC